MKLPSRLTVVTAMLVVLLPALAVLQYRWVGQLGDAARERMQRNLHNAAQQFHESFDGEVARAFLSLQVDSAIVRDGAWSRYAERHAAWATTAAYPALVANVYLIDAPDGGLRLRRWDAEARTFTDAPWTGVLETARAHFASEFEAFTAGDRRRPERRPLREYEGLLVAPLINIQFGPPPQQQLQTSIVPVFGFTVIELNLPLIGEQILPALAQRHFSHTDGDAYRVAVVDAANPSRVIYKSAPDAPTDPSAADVKARIFGAHHDPVLFLARGAARDAREGVGKRNLFVSVIREQRDDNVMTRTRVTNTESGRWLLLAQHERGSLDAAVGGVRQRNLLISFGILLLMGVSIALLAVTSRRAQRLAQQKMEFVAGVSHELRTPVAVIRSAAENLSQGVVGDRDHVRRYGEAIEIEARRLCEMIERVLQFAGIESGRVHRSPVAIEPLIQEAIEAAMPPSGETFTIDQQIAADLPLVVAEPTALRSAIQNLVANAMKYGGTDRWIGVRAETGLHERIANLTEVRITVEDHGRGIPPGDLPHIFDPFYRGGNATLRQVQGSGLGLALVQAIVEAHDGRVSVRTRVGAGSTFTLHLPTAASYHDKSVQFRTPNEAAAG